MRARACVLLAALAASCSPSAPPLSASAVPAAAVEEAPVSKTDAVAANAAFPIYRDALLADYLAMAPSWGRSLGLHEHDGLIADYSLAGLGARIKLLRRAQKRLKVYADATPPAAGADEEQRLDIAMLRNKVRLELFNLTERKLPNTDPRYYQELFGVSAYLDFDYAPLAERALKLVEHEEAALDQVRHVLANLQPVLSRPIVRTATDMYRGYAAYLRGDVRKALSGLDEPAFRQRFDKVNEALAAAAEEVAVRLESEYLARANDSAHVLGRERFLRFVEAQEGQHYPLAELKKMADEDLARNKAAYLALRDKVDIRRPKKEKLLSAATEIMDASRRFVIDKGLVTMVSDERCELRETPPFMRYNAAFLNMTGPFDRSGAAYYYITLPDPSWPKKEQEGYIFPWGVLLSTTVHEVYPGHFLHGLWIRKAPSRVQKMGDSYSFTEGWAHYAEQLMIEQGFRSEDPATRLGQLSDALLRNCRFVVSIGVHAEQMSLPQAAKRFVDDCFQDAATAREQAIRATFDPGYFAYTLGKLQILKLRAELKRELGARFKLRAFHDALLSHGAPPVALVAERVKAVMRAAAR